MNSRKPGVVEAEMTVTYRTPVIVAPEMNLADAAALMDRAGTGSLLVADDEELLGIVTDRDLVLRAVARRVPHDGRIDSVMTTGVLTLPVTGTGRSSRRARQSETRRSWCAGRTPAR
jgi:CBS domain-containing protein